MFFFVYSYYLVPYFFTNIYILIINSFSIYNNMIVIVADALLCKQHPKINKILVYFYF